MYFVRPPWFLRLITPDYLWRVKSNKREVFLTFDDGPVPEVSLPVLEILKQHNAHATFFCIGKQAEKHSEIVKRICDAGHSIGNHSYSHCNGWKTKTRDYVDDVMKCNEHIHSSLFRPPYGRITFSQARTLKKNFRIVMWDVLSGDYDANTSIEKCFQNVMKNVRPGSIIAFHDSLKAKDKVLEVLPKILEQLSKDGYSFGVITMS